MRLTNKRIRQINYVQDIEDDIYSKEYREDLIDSDSISAAEAGFMQGYEET